MTLNQKRDLLDHALRYAAMGWRVIPLKGKTAFTPHGVLDATMDTEIILNWWARYPNANIGIALGTDNWVLDVDPRHGGDESLESLELRHGKLPSTLQQQTGGGGRHYVWKRLPGEEIPQSVGKIGPGLDVKTGNGYIVGAPSIHPETHRPYIWDGTAEFDQQHILPAPQWLVRLAQGEMGPGGKPAAAPLKPKFAKGEQHRMLVSLAGTMRRRECDEEEIAAALIVANRNRCEQPGTEKEMRGIARRSMKWNPVASSRLGARSYINGHTSAVKGHAAAQPPPHQEPDPSPEPKPDFRTQAELAIAAIVEKKEVSLCWSPEFIETIARGFRATTRCCEGVQSRVSERLPGQYSRLAGEG